MLSTTKRTILLGKGDDHVTVEYDQRADRGRRREPDGGEVHQRTGGGVAVHDHPEARKAVALVLALTAGLSLILALFVSIAVNSGPNGIRLAVAGPPAAVEQIKAGVAQAGGADAFEVSVVGDEAAARSALQDRTVDGAIVIGPDGPIVADRERGIAGHHPTADGRGRPSRQPGSNRSARRRRGPAAVG